MPYISHKLGRTFYQSKGRNSTKTPLICLHGGPGGHARRMLPFFELAQDRKVFLYDQIGGGRSSAIPQEKWTIETFVWELSHLVKAWGIKEFHLLGISWGTTLALEYFARKRGRGIQSLTFQSPMFDAKDWQKDADFLIESLPAKPKKIINLCHEIGATDAQVYKDAMKVFYLKHVLRDKVKLEASFKTKNPNGNKVYNHMWGPSEFKATGTLKSYSGIKHLSKIHVPTLLICGQHDEARPATVAKYHKKIKSSQFEIINGASHAIIAEKPQKLLKTIKQFIDFR